jgi:DNA-binding NarL/FixJ family response regulator
MDINMPGLNGIDACRRICERRPESRVLILSMHGTSEHVYRALQAGARGYLLKESVGAEVERAVRALAAGRRYFGEKIADLAIDDWLGQRQKAASPLDSLSDREREILQLVVDGKTNAEAAALLGLSVKTVETYRSRMMTKLGVDDLPGLVRFAIEHGLTQIGK